LKQGLYDGSNGHSAIIKLKLRRLQGRKGRKGREEGKKEEGRRERKEIDGSLALIYCSSRENSRAAI
jgi:hypothetical protein